MGFVCILLTNAFMLTAPWVTKYAVDSLTESVTRQKLAYYGILIIGLAILGSMVLNIQLARLKNLGRLQ